MVWMRDAEGVGGGCAVAGFGFLGSVVENRLCGLAFAVQGSFLGWHRGGWGRCKAPEGGSGVDWEEEGFECELDAVDSAETVSYAHRLVNKHQKEESREKRELATYEKDYGAPSRVDVEVVDVITTRELLALDPPRLASFAKFTRPR